MLQKDQGKQWYEQELQIGEIDPEILVKSLDVLFKNSTRGYKVDVIHDTYKVKTPRCLKFEEIEKCRYDILKSQAPQASEKSDPRTPNSGKHRIPEANGAQANKAQDQSMMVSSHQSKQMAQGWVPDKGLNDRGAGRWRRKIRSWRFRRGGLT